MPSVVPDHTSCLADESTLLSNHFIHLLHCKSHEGRGSEAAEQTNPRTAFYPKIKRRKKQSQLYKQDNNLRGFGILCQNNIGQDKINGRSSRENHERKNKGMLKRKDSQ